MNLRKFTTAFITAVALWLPCMVSAQTGESEEVKVENGDTGDEKWERPSLFGNKGSIDSKHHFSWGADIGTDVDLTANDMTDFNITAYLGYKNNFLRFAGVGAGINTALNNSTNSYPLFAMLRTSFSSRPRLCFLDLRLGVTFNKFFNTIKQTDFYGSAGLGVTLATGRRFSSHLIIGYTFIPSGRKAPSQQADDGQWRKIPDLDFASIRIGCSF